MKNKVLSWNTFTLVSKFPCVCLSSTKKIIEKRWKLDSENLTAFALINNVFSLRKQKQKKRTKRTKRSKLSEGSHGWKTGTAKVNISA